MELFKKISINTRTVSFLRIPLFTLLIIVLVLSVFQPQSTVSAATTLTVTPLTWNIIGLDSNNVNVGPNHFPIGARVCNTGAAVATNVIATLVWDSANALINIRPGTSTSLSVSSLAIGACTDFYFEVEVTRNVSTYNTTRRYHIAVTADAGATTGSTTTPRELFVEHLVSQSRNTVSDVQYGTSLASLTSVANRGTMVLTIGNTYYIKLVGATATNGYEQIESFINFPNTVFQILSVSTTYTADTSPYLSSPNDRLYGDACLWENDPNSPNYRACNGVGKAGGGTTVIYQVRILSVGSTNPEPLSTLIYDFSGSSYHYNADFGVSTRYAYILDPSAITISKNFSPDPTTVGGVSTLTFTLTNPTPVTLSGLNFTDTLPTAPGAMVVASTPSAMTTGCGSPTFAPGAGATSLSFSNGSLAPNSSCTVQVNVTVPATGTYTNTSSHLFIDTLDTGNFATDTLTVNSAPASPAPVCGLTMAQWTFAGFTTNPPPFPAASTQAADVTTAAIGNGNGLTSAADTTASGGNPQPGIRNYGWQNAGPINTGTSAFIQFAVDTSKYTQVTMQFDAERKSNGPGNDELYYSTNGTTWTLKSTFSSTTSWATYGAYNFTGQTNTTGVTYFRIYGYGANATSSGNDINFDNVSFLGCGTPTPPTISKAFSPNPVAVGATSTLTFALTNPNTGVAFTGVSFTDTLPSGLTVPTGSSSQCGGTLSTTTPRTISFSGGTLAASTSCTINVTVTTTASGIYDNVSGFVSSTEGGTNSGTSGIASSSLTVLKPPSISKLFSSNPILAGGSSTLTFTITNPNQDNSLSNIQFSDTLPTSPAQMSVAATPAYSTTCGFTGTTPTAGATSLSFINGTVAAGSSCTLSVNVTAPSLGSYINTSGMVQAMISGTTTTGNTATDTLTVNSPSPAIGLLKQVSTGATGPWTSFVAVTAGTNVYYQFTIENAGDVALTSISISDPSLPSAATTCNSTWTDPLPVAVAGNNNHIDTCVVGPIAATSGSHTNTATASGTYASTLYTDSSSATYATTGVTLAKTVTETAFTNTGDLLHYSYLVTNSGFAPLLGPVVVSDNKVTVTCPAVSTVGDLDAYLDPGESLTCTATYTIVAADTTAGFVTNSASATMSSVTSNTTSQTVNQLRPDLIAAKSNNVSGIAQQNASFTWTITVSNSGTAAALFADTNVIISDSLPGASGYYPQGAVAVTNGSTPPTGTISCSITGTALSCAASGGAVTLPVNGSFSVTFSVTPTAFGSLANTVTVDPNANVPESNESNNTGSNTVTVIGITAVDDTGSTVNGTTGGQSFANVLTNDTLNGNPATLANITLTQVSTTNAGVTLDVTTGAVNVAAGTSAGNYTVTYQICDQTNPTICDTATVSVPVGVINAVDDTGSTVNGALGGQSLGNVLTNDTLNSNPATLANVNLTQVSTTNPGVTLDVTTGAINVAAGTPAGSYTVTYQICDQANPTICDTATVTVPVNAPPIVAVDDNVSGVNGVSGATAVLNVFNNDTLNGVSVVPSDVTLTETVPDPTGALTLNPDGTVDVAPGTAAGTYQLTYRICEVLNPTNCTTAVVRVTVVAMPPPIAQDDSGTTPFNTPVTLTDITANDTAFGPGNSIVINTLDLDPSTSGQQTSFTDSSGNHWSVNTTTGELTFTPAANFTGTATIPYSVQDTAGQTATANLSVTVGLPASISGTVFNDTDLNGTQGAGEAGIGAVRVDLYDNTGTTLIATVATTAGGSYSFANLAPGDYRVVETDPAGYVSTTPNSVPATVIAGGSATVNFGDYRLPNSTLSGIIGMVFNDANGNGIQDSGETALSGVTVELKNNVGMVIATTPTNALGSYSFPNLAAGTYTVTETDPSGFISTTLNNVSVNLSAGTTATINFGDQISGAAQIADPAVTKYGSPTSATIGSAVVYTITLGNNGTVNATNVVLTDTKPTFLDIISITISPNPGLTPVISGNTFIINFGTVAPTDSYIVTILTRVNSLGQPPGGSNNASITTSSVTTDRIFNNAFSAALQITSSSGGSVSNVRTLPDTGFAPGIVTNLSHTPREEYISTSDVMLEIPGLGIKIPVVGVPLKNGAWNVTWLGNQAGWLQGTAFPSWNGNSVLTSHVYVSNGLPGPFLNLNKLKFGEKIIVHAYGQKYTFEVQTNVVLAPNDTTAFKHEEKPWLTLVTCKEYDEKINTYRKRVVVRAVLVSVTAE